MVHLKDGKISWLVSFLTLSYYVQQFYLFQSTVVVDVNIAAKLSCYCSSSYKLFR